MATTKSKPTLKNVLDVTIIEARKSVATLTDKQLESLRNKLAKFTQIVNEEYEIRNTIVTTVNTSDNEVQEEIAETSNQTELV